MEKLFEPEISQIIKVSFQTQVSGSGPQSFLKLRTTLTLNEKLIPRKTIFKSYSDSQFLRYPAENVHGVLIKRKYQLDFDFGRSVYM